MKKTQRLLYLLLLMCLRVCFLWGCTPSGTEDEQPNISADTDMCTVTIDLDYEGQTQTQTVKKGEKATHPSQIPDTHGYQLRWVIYRDGEEHPWDFAVDTVAEDVTVYLIREDIIQECALINADGQGSVEIFTYKVRDGYKPAALSREGYTFLGWFEDKLAYKPKDGNRVDVSYTAYWSAVKAETKVFFGRYEQDGDTENGKEPIEWLVVDKNDDGSAYYLISSYILDWKPFHPQNTFSCMWSSSELRTWLNDGFMTTAFDQSERDAICRSTLDDTKTEDSVFLMAHNDSCYLTKDEDKVGRLTPYAKQKELLKPSSQRVQLGQYHGVRFWMRSGQNGKNTGVSAAYANSGTTPAAGYYHTPAGVRPAMWVDAAYLDELLN